MRTRLVSVCVRSAHYTDAYIDGVFCNKQKYCEKHGLECILTKKRRTDMSHPKWEKLAAILEAFRSDQVERVFWMDCDALVTNSTITLSAATAVCRDAPLALIRDWNGWNTGVFVTPRSNLEMLRAWYEYRHEVDRTHPPFKDQSALRLYMRAHPSYRPCEVVPQRALNSYPSELVLRARQNASTRSWKPGDFVYHDVDWNNSPKKTERSKFVRKLVSECHLRPPW